LIWGISGDDFGTEALASTAGDRTESWTHRIPAGLAKDELALAGAKSPSFDIKSTSLIHLDFFDDTVELARDLNKESMNRIGMIVGAYAITAYTSFLFLLDNNAYNDCFSYRDNVDTPVAAQAGPYMSRKRPMRRGLNQARCAWRILAI
jgi:hypothetical protein